MSRTVTVREDDLRQLLQLSKLHRCTDHPEQPATRYFEHPYNGPVYYCDSRSHGCVHPWRALPEIRDLPHAEALRRLQSVLADACDRVVADERTKDD